MACFILTDTGNFFVHKYVWGLSNEDQKIDTTKDAMRQLDEAIAAKLGDSLLDTEIDSDLVDDLPDTPDTVFTDDNEEENMNPIEPEVTVEYANEDATPEAYDEYLTAEVLLPQGGENKKAMVKKRKRGPYGIPMGVCNNSPLISRIY